MRAILAAIAVFFAFSFGAAAAEATPAEPKRKDAPDYPVSCEPAEGSLPPEHWVDVAFSVNREGLTEDVSIVGSTDPCFEEAALSAVRGWVYEPRRVNGRAEAQTGMQTRVTFVVKESEPTDIVDAKPLERVAPGFPWECYDDAAEEEVVVIGFEISSEGSVDNVKVIETTNSCFDEAATAAVKEWKYRPKTVDGKPQRRLGVITQLKFQHQGVTPPESKVRDVVSRRLNQARIQLKRGDAEKALETLERFEARYGASLSRKELAEFHRIRGYVRIKAKEYEGALDDFRAVLRLGPGDSRVAIEKRIVQLEGLLGYGPGQSEAELAEPDGDE